VLKRLFPRIPFWQIVHPPNFRTHSSQRIHVRIAGHTDILLLPAGTLEVFRRLFLQFCKLTRLLVASLRVFADVTNNDSLFAGFAFKAKPTQTHIVRQPHGAYFHYHTTLLFKEPITV
jgi:hypothetical protein